MNHEYHVQLEVAGPVAMFSRPDTGGTPTSFPAPTWSACKGIFESIAFFADGAGAILPTKVEICRRRHDSGGRIAFQRYTTNYGGPLRKASLLRKGIVSGGSSMQLFATVLTDVCYRLYGIVVGPHRPGMMNAAHYLRDLFVRRLKKGQCFRTPCLGWSEFTCSYWGPFREQLTEVDDDLNVDVPSMLVGIWDRSTQGAYSPVYQQDVRIERGVLQYPLPSDFSENATARAFNA